MPTKNFCSLCTSKNMLITQVKKAIINLYLYAFNEVQARFLVMSQNNILVEFLNLHLKSPLI